MDMFYIFEIASIDNIAVNIFGILFVTGIISYTIVMLLTKVRIPNKIIDNVVGVIFVGVGVATLYISIRWDLFL